MLFVYNSSQVDEAVQQHLLDLQLRQDLQRLVPLLKQAHVQPQHLAVEEWVAGDDLVEEGELDGAIV